MAQAIVPSVLVPRTKAKTTLAVTQTQCDHLLTIWDNSPTPFWLFSRTFNSFCGTSEENLLLVPRARLCLQGSIRTQKYVVIFSRYGILCYRYGNVNPVCRKKTLLWRWRQNVLDLATIFPFPHWKCFWAERYIAAKAVTFISYSNVQIRDCTRLSLDRENTIPCFRLSSTSLERYFLNRLLHIAHVCCSRIYVSSIVDLSSALYVPPIRLHCMHKCIYNHASTYLFAEIPTDHS